MQEVNHCAFALVYYFTVMPLGPNVRVCKASALLLAGLLLGVAGHLHRATSSGVAKKKLCFLACQAAT